MQSKLPNINVYSQYQLVIFVFGLLAYLTLDLQIYYNKTLLLILISINFILITIYTHTIKTSLLSLKIFKYMQCILTVIYTYFAINMLKHAKIGLIQSTMLIISITLIIQALSANFDLLLFNKYKVIVLDVILISSTIIILVYSFKYNLYSFNHSLTISTLILVSIIISYVLRKRIPLYFVLLANIFLAPLCISVLLVKASTTIAIIAYIQGYISFADSKIFQLIPIFTNNSLISIIISTVIASMIFILIENTMIIYVVYLFTLTLIVFTSILYDSLT